MSLRNTMRSWRESPIAERYEEGESEREECGARSGSAPTTNVCVCRPAAGSGRRPCHGYGSVGGARGGASPFAAAAQASLLAAASNLGAAQPLFDHSTAAVSEERANVSGRSTNLRTN